MGTKKIKRKMQRRGKFDSAAYRNLEPDERAMLHIIEAKVLLSGNTEFMLADVEHCFMVLSDETYLAENTCRKSKEQ